jgi:hypothetical protein
LPRTRQAIGLAAISCRERGLDLRERRFCTPELLPMPTRSVARPLVTRLLGT